jgi:hypothetical protein
MPFFKKEAQGAFKAFKRASFLKKEAQGAFKAFKRASFLKKGMLKKKVFIINSVKSLIMNLT